MEQNEFQNIEEVNSNSENRAKRDTNRIMGIAAIFISVLSIVAVIYQSYLAREENDLIIIQQAASVLPYLDDWYNNAGNEYKFIIENKGIGPAFIKDVKFIGSDPQNKDSLYFNSLHELFNFMMQQSSFLDSIHAEKSSINANMLLSPGERREYLVFTFNNDNQKRRFRKEFDTYYAGSKIIYADVYGSEWILDSEKGYPIKSNNYRKKPNR